MSQTSTTPWRPNGETSLFLSVIEHLPMGVHVYQLEPGDRLVFVGANPAADRILGVENRQFVGKTIEEAFPPLAATEVPARYRRAAAFGESWETEQIAYHDNEIAGAFYVRAFQSGPGRMAAAFFDVTERKRAEEALRESQALYHDLVETAQDLIWQVDAEGRYTYLNPAWEEVLGYRVEEMLGKRFSDFQAPEYAARDQREFARLLDGSIVKGLETVHLAKDGRAIRLLFNAKVLRDAEGRVCGTRGTAFDITARSKAEEELRLNEARLASLYRISQHLVDDEQAFLDFALTQAIELTGSRIGYLYLYSEARREFTLNSWSREVMQECAIREKKVCYELDQTGIWGEAVRQCRPILLNDFAAAHELKRGYPAGHVPLRRFLTVPISREGSIVAVVGVANKEFDYTEQDILQLKLLMDGVWRNLEFARAQQALRESEARLSESQHVARIGHYDLDIVAGNWTSSAVLDDIFGIDAEGARDLAGWLQIIHPDEREAMESYFTHEVLALCQPFNREYRIRRARDGAERWVLGLGRLEIGAGGRPLRMFGTIQDITERKLAEAERQRLEQQILHTQKLESLGVLAGGIAHDFNNILMTVIGNAGLARLRLPPESAVLENLRQIEEAASRAADLAKQMLAYSGKGKFVIEPVDLNRLAGGMEHMLQVSVSKKAILRFNFARPLPAVDADATQMRQVIMNLVINASEAIGERSGVIAVSTGCTNCTREYLQELWLDEQLPQGLYVTLEIADTGCGMDRETLARIFDPFFTTKFAGRGLGMAAVLGIVRGHRGAIKVYSEPGRGSTFKVFLPASTQQPLIPHAAAAGQPWRGSGTVLLADDEESVRAVSGEMLRELGLEVITASDGREALERYRERRTDLVILDLTMPHLDGEQAFRELRQLDPAVKVIMSSGYNEMEVTQKFSGKGLAAFIQKPYTFEALRSAVRGALE